MVGNDRLPRFRPVPTRLTPEGKQLLEEVCRENLPDYKLYVEQGGYQLLGGVSEFDPHILRRGEKLTILSARRYVGELLIPELKKKYGRRGRDMEVVVGRGTAFIRRGVRQGDVTSKSQFMVHGEGMAFYMKHLEKQTRLGSAVAENEVAVKGALAPFVSLPQPQKRLAVPIVIT